MEYLHFRSIILNKIPHKEKQHCTGRKVNDVQWNDLPANEISHFNTLKKKKHQKEKNKSKIHNL